MRPAIPRPRHKSILLSARDIGAAGHIHETARILLERGYMIELALHGLATTYFEHKGFSGAPIHIINASDFSDADMLFRRIQPQLLICGNSDQASLGIDEWLIRSARERTIPSICLQDFWGDVRRNATYQADHYAVMDDVAQIMTQALTDRPAHIIGSIKHTAFEQFDYMSLRQEFRNRFSLSSDARLVTFFGQNLSQYASYAEIVSDLASIIADHSALTLCYRPHPLESSEAIETTSNILSESGCNHLISPDVAAESVICGSDAILSSFSTIGLDAVHLLASKTVKPVPVIYLDYPSDLQHLWQTPHTPASFPLVETGQAFAARDRSALESLLQTALIDRSLPNLNPADSKLSDPVTGLLSLIDQLIDAASNTAAVETAALQSPPSPI